MAPEIFEEKYNVEVDIYAFGMTILEIATLETPYQECKNNPVKLYKKICSGIRPKGYDLIEDEDFKRFISRCLLPYTERPSAMD